jgi:hypothetical protein
MRTLITSLLIGVFTLSSAIAEETADPSAGAALNFQNPIKEVSDYKASAETLEQKLVSKGTFMASLERSKASSMANCQALYTGEAFINCQNKVEYAYLVLENLPNVMDRMDYQGATSPELKAKTDKETRKIAFALVKSAFNSTPNNE